ncbi:MAG: hypothetical protein R3D30_08405 [Hyphomicrobiales bacterium]
MAARELPIGIWQVEGNVCHIKDSRKQGDTQALCSGQCNLLKEGLIASGPILALMCDEQSAVDYSVQGENGIWPPSSRLTYSNLHPGLPELKTIHAAASGTSSSSSLSFADEVTESTGSARNEKDQCRDLKVGAIAGLPAFTAVAGPSLQLDWTGLPDGGMLDGTATIDDNPHLRATGVGNAQLPVPATAGEFDWSLHLEDGRDYRGRIKILSQDEAKAVQADLDQLPETDDASLAVLNNATTFARHELYQLAAFEVLFGSDEIREEPLLRNLVERLDRVMCPIKSS